MEKYVIICEFTGVDVRVRHNCCQICGLDQALLGAPPNNFSGGAAVLAVFLAVICLGSGGTTIKE